ncbi:MAG: radical SAM protein, partial [Candidatus Omnitrophica bacterium]|nr:radical SAM protein [Candidatus Omnitrophota bacterium]
MMIFGPVPSRRLGASLGINNLPVKHCSYSCVYCQVGPTPLTEVERRTFYSPEEIYRQVQERVKNLQEKGEKIDYLSFVPDGEPTLDLNLG